MTQRYIYFFGVLLFCSNALGINGPAIEDLQIDNKVPENIKPFIEQAGRSTVGVQVLQNTGTALKHVGIQTGVLIGQKEERILITAAHFLNAVILAEQIREAELLAKAKNIPLKEAIKSVKEIDNARANELVKSGAYVIAVVFKNDLNISKGSEKRKIIRHVVHPHYLGEKYPKQSLGQSWVDVAILQFEGDLPGEDFVPSEISFSGDLYSGKDMIVVGYGEKELGIFDGRKRYGTVPSSSVSEFESVLLIKGCPSFKGDSGGGLFTISSGNRSQLLAIATNETKTRKFSNYLPLLTVQSFLEQAYSSLIPAGLGNIFSLPKVKVGQ